MLVCRPIVCSFSTMLSLRSWATKREEVRTGKDTGTLGMFNAAVFVSQVKKQSVRCGGAVRWMAGPITASARSSSTRHAPEIPALRVFLKKLWARFAET